MAALVLIGAALAIPAQAARTVAQKKQAARTQFETAERMREALNGRAASQRSKHDYQRVIDAYRSVYHTAPTSNRADAAVVAVAELLADMGRHFNEEKTLRSAIGQYEFLRREYPGSKYRVQALFTIGQIYKEDLDDDAKARASLEEFLRRYPHSELADEARAGSKELDQETKERGKAKEKPAVKSAREEAPQATVENGRRTAVTGVRHWSTPDYTRVAIDLEGEVRYEAGRIPSPDRVFFDLHNTRLTSTLKGKSFDVQDGLLRRVRVAQFTPGETRIVLELDEVAEYSAFLLPNPYRLIIDVHGKNPQMLAKTDASNPPAPEPVKAASKPATDATAAKLPAVVESAGKQSVTGAKADTSRADSAAKQPSFDDLSEKVSKVNPAARTKADERKTAVNQTGKLGKAVTVSARKGPERSAGREAKPTATGERSLIRALGLKIGRIVVDAGHGGHDTGTIGPNGLLEKDLVLDVALRLGKLLESRMGAEVVYTRDDDTFIPLETRTALANQNQADLFISVHANSSGDPAARGVETYYLNFTTSADALEVAARENAVSETSIHELQDLVKKIALKDKIEESREFAVDVQQALYSSLATRGLRNRGVKKAPFIVLIGANMPSILAEISFVSNPGDAKRLKTPEYRQKIAESLYRGTAKYVSGLSGLKVASKISRDAVPVSSAASPRAASPSENQ